MTNTKEETDAAAPPAPTPDAGTETAKGETIEALKSRIAELEGKPEDQRDEGDTDTKPKIETKNKFAVTTRDGSIVVGNLAALANGVSVDDALNLAAWICIIADKDDVTDSDDLPSDLVDTIRSEVGA